MNEDEALHVVLESRAYSYLFFQNLFSGEPTHQSLEIVSSKESQSALGVYDTKENASYASSLNAAFEALNSFKENPNETVEVARDEYTRLFYGPGELCAPPWESIYVSNTEILFTEDTLAVRNAYRVQGFLPDEYPTVADDHIAYECAFMTQLANRMEKACSANDFEAFSTALDASLQFLNEHLLVWIPDYLKKMNGIENARLYPKIADLFLEFLHIDAKVLVEIQKE